MQIGYLLQVFYIWKVVSFYLSWGEVNDTDTLDLPDLCIYVIASCKISGDDDARVYCPISYFNSIISGYWFRKLFHNILLEYSFGRNVIDCDWVKWGLG